MSKVVETISQLTESNIQAEGFELVDLEFVKEGKNWYLRFYLDKPGGVDLEDCVHMSEVISELIDSQAVDPIPQAYFLEVSSPGAERPLKNEKDLLAAVGQFIHVSFYQAVNGEKFIEGVLKSVQEEDIVLEVKDKTRRKEQTIQRENISHMRLAIEF